MSQELALIARSRATHLRAHNRPRCCCAARARTWHTFTALWHTFTVRKTTPSRQPLRDKQTNRDIGWVLRSPSPRPSPLEQALEHLVLSRAPVPGSAADGRPPAPARAAFAARTFAPARQLPAGPHLTDRPASGARCSTGL